MYLRRILSSFTFLGTLGITTPATTGAPTPPAFGAEIRSVEFPHLLSGVAFLNHGSYGSPSKQVIDQERAIMDEYYADSDHVTRRLDEQYWDDTLAAVAPFFGTTPDRIAVTVSTTDGINAVLQSLTFASGDAILQNRFTYAAIKNVIADVALRNPGVSVVTLDHAYPIISTQHIIQEYTDILDANPNIRLAVIDHIASEPAIMFPIVELIQLCKQRGVIVLIDGAHAIGQVPLNLDTLGADFYTGSIHKWVFGARGSGLLYSAPQYDDVIKPNLVSYDHTDPFPKCFKSQGTRNSAPIYASPKAVEFYNSIGGIGAVSAYNTDLGTRMADMLVAAWGTSKLAIPTEMEAPFIKTVNLPPMPNYPLNNTGKTQLQMDVRDIYDIWASFGIFDNTFNLRLSTQIYCVENDYFRLRDAVLALQGTGADNDEETHEETKSPKTNLKKTKHSRKRPHAAHQNK